MTPTPEPGAGRGHGGLTGTVIADPADCSLQFDPVGKAASLLLRHRQERWQTTGCSYVNQPASRGQHRHGLRVGMATIPRWTHGASPRKLVQAIKTSVGPQIQEGLARANYPPRPYPNKRM